ncbi:hypothetical protein GE09DRAFT_614791 [Coniochaeta sp. 2T2.1]|nr:hypothetical protein GE09DRAFT_614791 [Coniochaeta sp. 2T2.1]
MAVTEKATTLLALAQRQLDRVVSPSTRRESWDRAVDFSARRPALFMFLTLLTLLTAPPILLFTTFVSSTILLALGAAVVFTLFWTGVALFFLVPALFIAVGFAMFFWAWAVASFIVARWLAGRMGFEVFGSGSGSGLGSGLVVKTNWERTKGEAWKREFERYKKEGGEGGGKNGL